MLKPLPLVVQGNAQPIENFNKPENSLLKIYGKQF